MQTQDLSVPGYLGVGGGDSWPLLLLTDNQSKEISAAIKDWIYCTTSEGFALWVCPDGALVRRFAEHCLRIGISSRVLAIRSARGYPRGEPLRHSRVTELGWDIVSVSLQDSLVQEEVLSPDGPLAAWTSRLNGNGLLPTQDAAENLFSLRKDKSAYPFPQNELVDDQSYVVGHFDAVEL